MDDHQFISASVMRDGMLRMPVGSHAGLPLRLRGLQSYFVTKIFACDVVHINGTRGTGTVLWVAMYHARVTV